MKSNPSVYPYIPFFDLSQKSFNSHISNGETITLGELRRLFLSIRQPDVPPQGKTTAERILSIFLHDEIRFGDSEFIQSSFDIWIEKLNFFIGKRQKILLTLLGFPFKVHVPLKTERRLPDMGEILVLARLAHIVHLIKKVYPIGAKITLFTEGAFALFAGVELQESHAYAERIKVLVSLLGLEESIEMRAVSEAEHLEGFHEHLAEKKKSLEALYDTRDAEFMRKYEHTYGPVYRIVSSPEEPIDVLMDVYNEELASTDASEKVREIRNELEKKTHTATMLYLAYLATVHEMEFLVAAVPNALPLTISPKYGRLGIQPIGTHCTKLPHHGVTVFGTGKQEFTIEYRVDILRDGRSYTPVHLQDDIDPKPFFYRTNSI